MRKIDIDQWNRKETYLFYKDIDVPMYMMTFQLDVTHFYEEIKKRKLSFYLSFMHLVMGEMNKIENYRYRFLDGEPYLVDRIHPSYTDQIDDSDQFKIVTVDYDEDLVTFIHHAKEVSKKQGKTFIDLTQEVRQDLVYITTFPWASFMQVSHAHMIDNKDAIPRVAWGKFEQINQKYIMPFAIESHHAFVDGRHVGMLIQNLQNAIHDWK